MPSSPPTWSNRCLRRSCSFAGSWASSMRSVPGRQHGAVGAPRHRSIHVVKGPDHGKSSSAAGGESVHSGTGADLYVRWSSVAANPNVTSGERTYRQGSDRPCAGSDGRARRTRRPCSRAPGTDESWAHVDRKMLWSPAASSDRQRRRVLARVKVRRYAPPPLRGAGNLGAGSAHALRLAPTRKPIPVSSMRGSGSAGWRTCLTMPNHDPLHVVVDDLSSFRQSEATVDIGPSSCRARSMLRILCGGLREFGQSSNIEVVSQHASAADVTTAQRAVPTGRGRFSANVRGGGARGPVAARVLAPAVDADAGRGGQRTRASAPARPAEPGALERERRTDRVRPVRLDRLIAHYGTVI